MIELGRARGPRHERFRAVGAWIAGLSALWGSLHLAGLSPAGLASVVPGGAVTWALIVGMLVGRLLRGSLEPRRPFRDTPTSSDRLEVAR